MGTKKSGDELTVDQLCAPPTPAAPCPAAFQSSAEAGGGAEAVPAEPSKVIYGSQGGSWNEGDRVNGIGREVPAELDAWRALLLLDTLSSLRAQVAHAIVARALYEENDEARISEERLDSAQLAVYSLFEEAAARADAVKAEDDPPASGSTAGAAGGLRFRLLSRLLNTATPEAATPLLEHMLRGGWDESIDVSARHRLLMVSALSLMLGSLSGLGHPLRAAGARLGSAPRPTPDKSGSHQARRRALSEIQSARRRGGVGSPRRALAHRPSTLARGSCCGCCAKEHPPRRRPSSYSLPLSAAPPCCGGLGPAGLAAAALRARPRQSRASHCTASRRSSARWARAPASHGSRCPAPSRPTPTPLPPSHQLST